MLQQAVQGLVLYPNVANLFSEFINWVKRRGKPFKKEVFD